MTTPFKEKSNEKKENKTNRMNYFIVGEER